MNRSMEVDRSFDNECAIQWYGLVNGSIGYVVGFIYNEGKNAPSLPYSIIIKFNDYTGVPFFSGVGQEKWVPVLASEYKWGEENMSTHFRKQFSLSLSWALTVWKSQGLTIKGLLAYFLGKEVKEHGLTYVAFSRILAIEQLFVGQGFSLNRLTTDISKGCKLKKRLEEDERLQMLYEETKRFYNFLWLLNFISCFLLLLIQLLDTVNNIIYIFKIIFLIT